MNEQLQRNVERERRVLLTLSDNIARRRRAGFLNSIDHDLYAIAVQCFYDQLDRVWEAQCMASASY
jgi:hypothetical protein